MHSGSFSPLRVLYSSCLCDVCIVFCCCCLTLSTNRIRGQYVFANATGGDEDEINIANT